MEIGVEAVKACIDNGSRVDSRNATRQTPLMVALELGCTDVADFLIANGAQLHLNDSDHNTVLHYAAKYRCNRDLLQFILSSIDESLVGKLNKNHATAQDVAADRGVADAMDWSSSHADPASCEDAAGGISLEHHIRALNSHIHVLKENLSRAMYEWKTADDKNDQLQSRVEQLEAELNHQAAAADDASCATDDPHS